MKLRLALSLALLPAASFAQDALSLYRTPGGGFAQQITSELGHANHKTFGVSTTLTCPIWANVMRFYQPSPTTAFVLQKANGVGAPSNNDVTDGTDWHPLQIGVDLTKPVSGSAILNVAVHTRTSPTTVYWDCGM